MPTKPLALPPSVDAHQALGSPSGRAGAKRLRGLTAPILPTSYPQIHCTDSLYETAFQHELSAHPSPPPFGRYLSRRERQELCANLKRNDKPKFIAPSTNAHRTLGSPSGRAGAKRLRGLTAPILPISYPQIHCTDSLYETAFLHELSAHPSPPPFGRYLSRRERQGPVCKLQAVRQTGIDLSAGKGNRQWGENSV